MTAVLAAAMTGADAAPRRSAYLDVRAARAAQARAFAEEIALDYDVTAADILGRSRVAPLPAARHELMARMWKSGLTLKDIARTLGMDHTSVLHGVRKTLGEQYAQLTPGPGRSR